MAGIKFIVSDETLNSHGFIVLTAGINTARFERNPVMLYMHDRENGVMGRWENLCKYGGKLTADAVFDECTELGAKVTNQVKNGLITDNDRTSFLAMAVGNIKAFRAYCSGRRQAQKAEIDTLLKRNMSKILPQEQHTYRQVGERMDVDVLRSLIDSMPAPVRLSHVLNAANKDRSAWTLEDYRRFAPDELRDSPALYKRLVTEMRGNSHRVKDLDYYRRHEPEYLEAHPELYAQLIEKELQKRK